MPQPTVTIKNLTAYWFAVSDNPDVLQPHGSKSYVDLKLSDSPSGNPADNTYYPSDWLDGWCLNQDGKSPGSAGVAVEV